MNIPKKPDTCAIILAAGSASRMQGIDKQKALLGNMNVLEMSVSALAKCKSVGEIIVAVKSGDEERVREELFPFSKGKVLKIVLGGDTRQKSAENCVKASNPEYDYFAMHDGARPLVKSGDIERTIADSRVFGAAVLGVPVKDTIKVVEGGLVADTPPRQALYITQTPQVFRRRIYMEGLDFALEHSLDFTDDCQLAEAVGVKVCITKGSYTNIKITTPEDIEIAKAILSYERGN